MNPVEAKHLIDEIPSAKRLSEWDRLFIKSMQKLIENGKFLTIKQSNKLQEIYRKSRGG